MSDHYKFELIPLPYPYNALEPYIDTETMTLHHNKHLKTYVDNLNSTLAPYPEYHNWSLEKFLKNICFIKEDIQIAVKNNAGGVYNHNLFFSIMQGEGSELPTDGLLEAINEAFGSFDNFKTKFKKCALEQFGSGYAWLAADKNGKLRILKTQNQDTILTFDLCPIMLIDVWEHAYYLKYQNRRSEYIDNWFNVVNWKKAEENFKKCIAE